MFDETERVKTVEVNGKQFKLTWSDPFGFCKVQPSTGPIPEEFKGQFTTQFDAEKAIKKFLNRKGYNVDPA